MKNNVGHYSLNKTLRHVKYPQWAPLSL